jgi:hypothetical protein
MNTRRDVSPSVASATCAAVTSTVTDKEEVTDAGRTTASGASMIGENTA